MPTQPLPAGVDPRTPVLIGVGQHLQRTDRGDPELSPAALMTESLRLALTDSGSDSPGALGRSLGWIGAVPALTWRYNDAAREVADSIGADGAITATCAMGGHSPNYLLGAAARAIATGALDVAAITGGEAGRARAAHRATGAQPDWGTQGDDVAPDQMVGPTELEMAHPAEAAHRLYMPTQMYPLFETALRAASGRCIDDHQADVGELWAGFAGVAACNPHAWDRTPYTAAELITPSASNRWVGWPYTKHLVSNARVDMGASVLVASAQAAAAAGVPTDRWIFLHSGTDAVDRLASERASFADSPAMRIAGGRALQLAGLTPNDLDFIDLYSCFPSAVQLAANVGHRYPPGAHHLGRPVLRRWPLEQPGLTCLGRHGGRVAGPGYRHGAGDRKRWHRAQAQLLCAGNRAASERLSLGIAPGGGRRVRRCGAGGAAPKRAGEHRGLHGHA